MEDWRELVDSSASSSDTEEVVSLPTDAVASDGFEALVEGELKHIYKDTAGAKLAARYLRIEENNNDFQRIVTTTSHSEANSGATPLEEEKTNVQVESIITTKETEAENPVDNDQQAHSYDFDGALEKLYYENISLNGGKLDMASNSFPNEQLRNRKGDEAPNAYAMRKTANPAESSIEHRVPSDNYLEAESGIGRSATVKHPRRAIVLFSELDSSDEEFLENDLHLVGSGGVHFMKETVHHLAPSKDSAKQVQRKPATDTTEKDAELADFEHSVVDDAKEYLSTSLQSETAQRTTRSSLFRFDPTSFAKQHKLSQVQREFQRQTEECQSTGRQTGKMDHKQGFNSVNEPSTKIKKTGSLKTKGPRPEKEIIIGCKAEGGNISPFNCKVPPDDTYTGDSDFVAGYYNREIIRTVSPRRIVLQEPSKPDYPWR